MSKPLRILVLEPYMGGSHAALLEGLREHSRHEITTWGLPARKWKWRMRGAALTFADQLAAERPEFDLLFCSDFLDLAALVGLRPEILSGPKVVYFHENQLTYPVQDEAERDYQFAFTNITTCLSANYVLFNTEYHRQEFLGALPSFLQRMPDHRPQGVPERIAKKSEALYPGIDLTTFAAAEERWRSRREGPLMILWNHRWEYDKAPDAFFAPLIALADEGLDFRVCVLGETFRDAPKVFAMAKERLGDRIVQFGFAESREAYADWLGRADVIVSTAIHEFFGISVVEAMAAGCFPLLPNRLSYPELIPEQIHADHLYEDDADMMARLRKLIHTPESARGEPLNLSAERFGWDTLASQYDDAFEGAVGTTQ